MKSPSTSRVSVSGIPDDVLEEFDTLVDAEGKNRSQKIVELIEQAVADTVSDDDDTYRPAEDTLNVVYEAAVETAKKPSHILRFDLHAGELAQQTSIGQKAVRGHLFRLERRGYVRHQLGDGLSKLNRETYRVKPLCANPKMWRYSRIYNPNAGMSLHANDSKEGDQVPSLGCMEQGIVD